MLQSLRNIWDIPDLRKRVLFTLGMLAVFRLGSHIPTPGINPQALIDFFEQNRSNWFGLVDMFSGGNLAKVTIFALGVMPYISASIILQLLTVVWPYLERLSKEGELGRRKITQWTRYLTIGIAATAVGDWSTARAAWRGYGIPIPAGEGPIELPLGPIPIRLDPDGASEVVWCRRLDPARAVIENVPLPASGRRFGDVLLTDGEPRGTRRVQGREVPVFNEIEVLETSLYKTWSAVAEAEDAAGIEALQDLATERGLAAEDWSALRVLCRACSEGRPHAHNRDPGSENESGEADGERTVGLAAATAEEARDLLNAWSAAAPGRTWSDLRIELD